MPWHTDSNVQIGWLHYLFSSDDFERETKKKKKRRKQHSSESDSEPSDADRGRKVARARKSEEPARKPEKHVSEERVVVHKAVEPVRKVEDSGKKFDKKVCSDLSCICSGKSLFQKLKWQNEQNKHYFLNGDVVGVGISHTKRFYSKAKTF